MNINMKKKLIVTSLLAASVLASAANAADIKITGSIAATPCKVKTTTTTGNVTMPSIFEGDMKGVNAGDAISKSATQIKIDLEGCPTAAGNSNAVVTFTGAGTGDTFSLGGTVKGVALKVYDKADKEVKATNGTAISQTNTITPTLNQTLEYKLKYVKTADTFKEGAVDTTLSFNVDYN
ncbi:fimbrial protein [Yersinia mollaretii]|uniref:fimbrial protein n=1 Tax=Yersinia mollaretii TaxID=33060 RepID=UPI0005E11C29|nr:fimbrial protein [Yersinia mollaretii]CNK24059.1 putative fimbrial protein [Yersinia enterocolitica]